MKRTFLAAFAALFAVPAAVPAIAAAVGPPSGVYLFGDLTNLDLPACGGVDVFYSVWFGAPGSNIENVASVLRSNGAGAVKLSTAVPFIVNEAKGSESFNIHYGPWMIMTFNPGSTTTGTIVFDSVSTDIGAPTEGAEAINFKEYFQDFDPRTGRLGIQLTAEFPHCSIDLAGTYEQ